jgi:CMP/dCMP kinase
MKPNCNKISLTGDLGSGKSAVSKILSEKLEYRIVSTGGIQREIAAKHGLTTLELNEYTKSHPEIDDEIDGKVTELSITKEPIIFDSRLAWHFAPDSFKVYLIVDPYIAAERIFHDQRTSETYNDIEEARLKIMARRKSELERFKTYYNINYSDLRNYNLIVDTSQATPEEVAACVISGFNAWSHEKEFDAFYLSPRSLYPTRMICCDIDKDTGKVTVLQYEHFFLILNGHSMVSKAIAENCRILAVEVKNEEYTELLHKLKKTWLKQWENMNFVRFREYPDIYK